MSAEIHQRMRARLSSWLEGIYAQWDVYQHFPIAGFPEAYPLSPGFIERQEWIGSNVEWVGDDGTHHNYSFAIGFAGFFNDICNWGIVSGDIWFAILELPANIYNVPTFVLDPRILFEALLASLDISAPVRVATSLEIVVQDHDMPGPSWRRHYELSLHGGPNLRIATQLLQVSAPPLTAHGSTVARRQANTSTQTTECLKLASSSTIDFEDPDSSHLEFSSLDYFSVLSLDTRTSE
ncbi:hypothetical protein C8R45DRAFT_1094454 [Mycena sanguinolenta]|nr:hypothetical protein C8R45DRAFT_1094454 [Mycena sanguinolenta]